MVEGRDRAEWEKLSQLLAFQAGAAGKKHARARDYNPYGRARVEGRTTFTCTFNGSDVDWKDMIHGMNDAQKQRKKRGGRK